MRFAIAALTGVVLAATLVSPRTFAERIVRIGDGPSAKGRFEILPASEGTPARSIEFNAEITPEGKTIGEVVFQEKNKTNATGESKADEKPLFLRAECDCLLVNANKAVMSGSIVQSSVESYVGRRLLLVAQDNGGTENPLKRDRLTYGLYRLATRNWVVTDSERPDESSPVSTVATDAERPDDVAVRSDRTSDVGCQTFPLSSFSFLDAATSRGTVRVRP